jgi:hypothetical protein
MKFSFIILPCLLFACFLSSCSEKKQSTQPVTTDAIIAKGKGFEISQSQLDEVMFGIKAAAAVNNKTITSEELLGMERQLLARLIKIQLLLQIATDADKSEGKSKAELQISNLLERTGSQENFERQLKSAGLTEDELRIKAMQDSTATAVIMRELAVTVSDTEAKKFYDDHPASFQDLKIPDTTSDIKPEYESVEAKIKNFLLEQKLEKLAPPFYAKLEKDADVQILNPDLKPTP